MFFVMSLNRYGLVAEIAASESFVQRMHEVRRFCEGGDVQEVTLDGRAFGRLVMTAIRDDYEESVTIQAEPVQGDTQKGDLFFSCSKRGLWIKTYRPASLYGEESRLTTWSNLGVESDAVRCRYTDCVEAHPVAGDDELVTCHTCRKELFGE